jgi:SAM-dependent methyltransferase
MTVAPNQSCASRERIESAVLEKYRGWAAGEGATFPYRTGREGAEKLGYGAERLAEIPAAVLQRFVGVGNVFELRVPERGERVLDVGCGSGVDVWIAGLHVGDTGRAIGIDLSGELVELARREASRTGLRFVEGAADALPFEDGSFDQVISNGALNLVFDKPRAFRELRRVLKPGGTLAIADLLVIESVPDQVLADMDAWST